MRMLSLSRFGSIYDEIQIGSWHLVMGCISVSERGSHVWRINSFFTELLPRLNSVELAGAPKLLATTFVGGLKHLPIRYSLD